MGRFFKELRRRHVFTVAVLYIVAAWVAIQVVDLAIEAGYLRGWSLRNAWNAAFVGFPLALIVGWFYDISRKGIVRIPPAHAVESYHKSLHRKDYVLLPSLVAVWAVAYFFVHSPPVVDKSIAVLPFENRGHDPQGADLAFGVVLDLQTQLEKLRDIKVIAQPSVERIEKGLPIPAIAQKLGVAFIMKGTVERVLDQVRVSVTLIDVERDEQAWSKSYDRELSADNLFDIRDEIAGAITGSLQAELSPQELERIQTRPTENFAAYEAYLLGKQRMVTRTTDSIVEAEEYFQRAISLDPDFALAYVGLADTYRLLANYAGLPHDEMDLKGQTAIDKALQLNDQLGEAHTSLANLRRRRGDSKGAEAAFDRALELNPNYMWAYLWYGELLAWQVHRPKDALPLARRAVALNPVSAASNYVLGNILGRLGRLDEALLQFEKTIEVEPTHPNGSRGLATTNWSSGKLDKAVAWFRKTISLDPGVSRTAAYLGRVYLALGDDHEAEFWAKRSMELAPEGYWPNATMERLHVYRGEEDTALDYARKLLTIDPTALSGRDVLRYRRDQGLQVAAYAEARTRFEQNVPELLNDDEPNVDTSNFREAIDLAYVLSKTGEQERANLLLADSLTAIQGRPRLGVFGYQIADVRIYALQGETRKALTALRQAIDEGWRFEWWYHAEHDLHLDSIREESEFQAMMDEVRADMAAQLERVRAMEASGELEPVPDIN